MVCGLLLLQQVLYPKQRRNFDQVQKRIKLWQNFNFITKKDWITRYFENHNQCGECSKHICFHIEHDGLYHHYKRVEHKLSTQSTPDPQEIVVQTIHPNNIKYLALSVKILHHLLRNTSCWMSLIIQILIAHLDHAMR